MTERMDAMERRISALERSLKELNRKFEGYTRNEADASEEEMFATVQAFVATHYIGYHSTQDLRLKHIEDPFHPHDITELDGLLILTPSKESLVAREQWNMIPQPTDMTIQSEKERRNQIKTIKKHLHPISSSLQEKIMVIVEAKHHVQEDDIDEKLDQLVKIRNSILEAKEYMAGKKNPKWTESFKKFVKYTRFHEFSPYSILMVGGLQWERKAKSKLQQFSTKEGWTDRIGILAFSGQRYKSHMFDHGELRIQEGGAVLPGVFYRKKRYPGFLPPREPQGFSFS